MVEHYLSGCHLAHRQGDGENGTLGLVVADADGAVMQVHIVAGNVETDAAACLRAVVGGRLIEASENVGLVAVGNALASIGHRNDGLVAVVDEAQGDAAARRGELQGVGEEVIDHLVHLLAIIVHDETVHIVFETQVDAAFLGIVAKRYENAVQMVYDIALLKVQRLATGIQTTEVE